MLMFHFLTVVYVIEFQKRGLPHAHILLWLEEYYRCKAATNIDDIISAELPSPIADPARYKAVSDYMLHRPCGKDNRAASCNIEGKCSKHFPKPFYAEIVIDQDEYLIYRRRDDKVCVKKGNFTFDNKHVVPHNRYLLLKYQAHINVEWCNRSKAIKYLFKYLNKGPDRATIVIQENVQQGQGMTKQKVTVVDEIKNYLNYRYLAPCEVVWRIFSFDIHHSYPGPQKFEQLLMVNDRICATFKEACFAYGLLNEDKEWTLAIQEASLWALGPQLCDLFVTILLFCYLTMEHIQNYCLMEIHDLLNTNGRTLTEFSDMPQPNPTLLTSVDNRLIREARAFDINKSRIPHQLYPQLNLEQRLIYEEVVDSVHNKKGQFHFVYGPRGIASLLLPGGMTAHSRQILLVVPKGKRANIVQACINRSELWKHYKVLAIGDGKVPARVKDGEDEPTWIEIQETFLIPSSESPIQQIVKETYPNFIQRQKDDAYLRERVILTHRNADADVINAYMFDNHNTQDHLIIYTVKMALCLEKTAIPGKAMIRNDNQQKPGTVT
ncbi:ATP-dependent DNA helicase PIF1-like protein [Tanacetum coccineum]